MNIQSLSITLFLVSTTVSFNLGESVLGGTLNKGFPSISFFPLLTEEELELLVVEAGDVELVFRFVEECGEVEFAL
jgi:hypothetical protein